MQNVYGEILPKIKLVLHKFLVEVNFSWIRFLDTFLYMSRYIFSFILTGFSLIYFATNLQNIFFLSNDIFCLISHWRT